jgi:hypothetical protein
MFSQISKKIYSFKQQTLTKPNTHKPVIRNIFSRIRLLYETILDTWRAQAQNNLWSNKTIKSPQNEEHENE